MFVDQRLNDKIHYLLDEQIDKFRICKKHFLNKHNQHEYANEHRANKKKRSKVTISSIERRTWIGDNMQCRFG